MRVFVFVFRFLPLPLCFLYSLLTKNYSLPHPHMILTANIGSASKKYSVFRDAKEILRAHFEREGKTFIVTWTRDGATEQKEVSTEQYEKSATLVIEQVNAHGTLSAIGVRVVAPGSYFQEHRRINEDFLTKLTKAQEFAPLHVTATLAEINTLRTLFPTTPLFAASDSAFHKTLPAVASTYALPRELTEKFELRRFGYHGLSLSSVVEKLRASDGSLPEKVIVCHLGSGSSITAIKNGASIATSMGFSPLEGLVSSTRSGSIDPSIALLLAEKSGLSTRELEKKLNSESGLLAVGGSNDIRELLKMEKKGDANAKLALEIFVSKIREYIGAYAVILGGLDAIVFTGTIGERSAIIRERILADLEFLKIKLATRVNNKLLGNADGEIQKPASKVALYVFKTNEAQTMAKTTRLMLSL
jgi:acetate kinase